jgi:ribosomal protein S18 acetylase RimI-like enzyme
MPSKTIPVERLGPDDFPAVVRVLSESFFDYPVMRWVLGSTEGYAGRLSRLLTFFAEARVLRDEWLLGTRGTEGLTAVALVAYPGARESPDELAILREQLWSELGPQARARYQSFGEATSSFAVEDPHLHLSMIGTRRSARGSGLGRRLMDAVHGLSRQDVDSIGVSLTTEDEANVSLYLHMGYELIGRTAVGSRIITWGFFRKDGS